jgi:LPXTG-site transpeptidase (sortase) family protein
MTFLLLPYILSVYAFGGMPSVLQEEATQMLANASAVPTTEVVVDAVLVPPSLPDLSEAFLASRSTDQWLALSQDVETLPLEPIEESVLAAPVIAEVVLTPSPTAQPNSPGIFVLPALPVIEKTVAPVAVVTRSPTPKPSPVASVIATPSPRPVLTTPTPTATLYIPPRPTSVPTPTVNYAAPVATPSTIATPYYPPVVAPPAAVASPRPIATPAAPVQAPVQTTAPAAQAPVAAPVTSGLRGPIMKAVQSDNLPTYYLNYPRLGLANVPVNPTDASNDQTWKNTLIKGVGQLLYPPDMGHKTVIFGHSSNYASVKSDYNYIFKPLYQAKVGDTASITYQGKQLNYVVKKTEIVPATTASIVTDYGREELVLFTCWPYLTSKDRFIVYLDRV